MQNFSHLFVAYYVFVDVNWSYLWNNIFLFASIYFMTILGWLVIDFLDYVFMCIKDAT